MPTFQIIETANGNESHNETTTAKSWPEIIKRVEKMYPFPTKINWEHVCDIGIGKQFLQGLFDYKEDDGSEWEYTISIEELLH